MTRENRYLMPRFKLHLYLPTTHTYTYIGEVIGGLCHQVGGCLAIFLKVKLMITKDEIHSANEDDFPSKRSLM